MLVTSLLDLSVKVELRNLSCLMTDSLPITLSGGSRLVKIDVNIEMCLHSIVPRGKREGEFGNSYLRYPFVSLPLTGPVSDCRLRTDREKRRRKTAENNQK